MGVLYCVSDKAKEVVSTRFLREDGDPFRTVKIRAVWVYISTQTICYFLHGPDFYLPANTTEIDYCIDEIWKVKTKKISLEDKLTIYNGLSVSLLQQRKRWQRWLVVLDIFPRLQRDV